MPSLIEIVGSLNMDLVTVTQRMPLAGETLAAKSFSTGFGGKGANQAVAAARLCRESRGASPGGFVEVAMHGTVGDDQHGQDFLAHLRNEGIDVSGVSCKPKTVTGTAVIIVEEDSGENRILITAGANAELTPSSIHLKEKTNPTDVHVVLYQMEIPLATLVESMRQAVQMSKRVILNTAPASKLPEEAYDMVDVLILNEVEASFLSGIAVEELDARLDDVAATFFNFGERGVRAVVITLASKGAYYCENQRSKTSKPSAQGVVIPSSIVERVVDTTAAGDTFCGALAAHMASPDGSTLRSGIEFANKAAARTIQKQGAQSSIPFRGEV